MSNEEYASSTTGPCYYCGRSGASAPRPGLARSCGHAPCPAAPVAVQTTARETAATAGIAATVKFMKDLQAELLVNQGGRRKPLATLVTNLSYYEKDKLFYLWDAAGWVNKDSPHSYSHTYCKTCRGWVAYIDTLCLTIDEFGNEVAPTPICKHCYTKP